ncbi:MAG TPA: NUDIX domain-containing protein [Anaerolineales bacterium]|nr:NUDIX domain-containing protein [Anaerolineales bacterium]
MSKRIEVKYCIRCGNAVEQHSRYGQVRPVCPSCGWIHFADPKVAVGVLVEKDDKILLVQRAFNPYRGKWSLPAGFINAGEDPAEAARRECLEETGLNTRIIRLLDIYAEKEHAGGADFIILYSAEIIDGELQASDDAIDAKFFVRANLPELAFKATRHFLENF